MFAGNHSSDDKSANRSAWFQAIVLAAVYIAIIAFFVWLDSSLDQRRKEAKEEELHRIKLQQGVIDAELSDD